MNGFGWDLPAGAAEDERAPWNQEDAEPCDECAGEGVTVQGLKCEACNGTGEEGNQEWKPFGETKRQTKFPSAD